MERNMEDPKFDLGIKNAVRVCMNVTSGDRVFIITDQETSQIGAALEKEALSTGAACFLAVLEDYGSRPFTDLPAELVPDLVGFKPTVTFYAAQGQEGEVKMRMALTGQIKREFADMDLPVPRHGHMISITPQLIREGMNADYQEINRITLKIHNLVKDAREIKVTSSSGTDITASFSPDHKWVPSHGLYHSAGDWGNLPEGEVFTCPLTLDGVLVVSIIGDYFSPKYGVLDSPIIIKVKDGRVTEVSGENQEIAKELLDYLDSAENGRRVGEFAIGTNTAVTKLSGNLLQDEKIPGIHVAFGNPAGNNTGADWSSDVHVDVIPIEPTIIVDGKKIMEDGKFLV
jgi:aminopeptidase